MEFCINYARTYCPTSQFHQIRLTRYCLQHKLETALKGPMKFMQAVGVYLDPTLRKCQSRNVGRIQCFRQLLSVLRHAACNIVNLNGPQPHHTELRYRATGWGNTWQQPGTAMGPVFFFFFIWDCPETECDFAVPFCLMLISVIFVVYYSYTLCLQMLSFIVLKIWENRQHPLAEHRSREWDGWMVGALPTGLTLGGRMEICPRNMKLTKSPPAAALRMSDRKTEYQEIWSSAQRSTPHGFWHSCEPPTSPPRGIVSCMHCCMAALYGRAQDALWAALKFYVLV